MRHFAFLSLYLILYGSEYPRSLSIRTGQKQEFDEALEDLQICS